MASERYWSLLDDLLKIKSPTGENSQTIINAVADYLAKHNISYKIHKFKDENDEKKVYWALSAERGTQENAIALVGHLDVVQAVRKNQWHYKKEKGYLVGRGVADAKGPTAVAIQAFIDADISTSSNRLHLFLSTDEEIGGVNGAKKLFEAHQFKETEFAIAVEPAGKIIIRFFGVLRIAIRIKNRRSHTKTGRLNAINIYCNLATRIQAHLQSFGQDPELGFSLYNPTFIEAGSEKQEGTNSGRAYIKVDMRTVPDINPDVLYDEIVQIAKTLENEYRQKDATARIDISKVVSCPPLLTNANNHYVQQLQKQGYTLGSSRGSSDAKWATCPAVELGPRGYGPHSANERISLSNLQEFYDDLLVFLNN